MSNPKVVFKRNNGGEIRGYPAAEPPKTPPFEETSSVTARLKGAGDAVKSPYSDTLGTKSALQMYQGGNEVGKDTRLSPDMIRSTILTPEEVDQKASQYTQEISLDNTAVNSSIDPQFLYESTLTSEQRDQVNATRMKERMKQLHGEKFKENVYDQVANLSREQRREYIPVDPTTISYEERQAYTTPEAIYNTLAIEHNNYLQGQKRTYELEKNAFDAVVGREKTQRSMDELNTQYYRQKEGAVEDFLYKTAGTELTSEEQAEFDTLLDLPLSDLWGEEAKELYAQLYDYDTKLNVNKGWYGEGFDSDQGYHYDKFPLSRRISDNVKQATSIQNEWLTKNLGSLGSFVGEGLVSTGNLVDPEGSTSKLLASLSELDLKGMEEAAGEVGLDLFNVLALATIATGGEAAMVLPGLIRKAGYKGAVTLLTTNGWKQLAAKYKKIPRIVRLGIEMPSLATGIYGGGKFAYDRLTGDSAQTMTMDALAAMSTGLTETLFGPDYQDRKNIHRLLQAEIDPNASYIDTDQYLERHPEWGNMSEAYNYFHPGEDIPDYLTNTYDVDEVDTAEKILANKLD